MKHLGAALITGIAIASVALPAHARETFHDLDVAAAVASEDAEGKLLDVPYYFKGQEHPKVASVISEPSSNRRTNAFGKSDERACTIAFLSSLIAMQEAAKRAGADGVVDLMSITKHRDLESETQYRCVAGVWTANVVLKGKLVKFAE